MTTLQPSAQAALTSIRANLSLAYSNAVGVVSNPATWVQLAQDCKNRLPNKNTAYLDIASSNLNFWD